MWDRFRALYCDREPQFLLGNEELRRRFLLTFFGVLILVSVVVYSSFQCKITKGQITVSSIKVFVVPVADGYALGLTFNVTNSATCQLTAESILLTLENATFQDGNHTALESSESQSLLQTLLPKQSSRFSYVFDSIFEKRPVDVMLKIEMTFSGSGKVMIFEGELSVPA